MELIYPSAITNRGTLQWLDSFERNRKTGAIQFSYHEIPAVTVYFLLHNGRVQALNISVAGKTPFHLAAPSVDDKLKMGCELVPRYVFHEFFQYLYAYTTRPRGFDDIVTPLD